MTPTEAAALFAQLRAAYPDARAKVDSDTAGLWLKRLRGLDRSVAAPAVDALIDGCKFWPTIAELNEQVTLVRDRQARAWREAERRRSEKEYDELELPPLQTIPAYCELLDWFELDLPKLPRVDDGTCDDCNRAGARVEIGRVQVCADCARLRLRAAARLAENNEAA